jgi:hypothetical protein
MPKTTFTCNDCNKNCKDYVFTKDNKYFMSIVQNCNDNKEMRKVTEISKSDYDKV